MNISADKGNDYTVFLTWLRGMGDRRANDSQWDAVYEGKILKGVNLKLFLNKKKKDVLLST